jgi:hypothetical protein
MGKLYDQVRKAVKEDRFIVSWHADEKCEERAVSDWQIVVGLAGAKLVRERPRSKPNPSIVVRQELADGTVVEVVWSWLSESQRAKLVTVYFPE